jgi:hypothetical protein
MWWSNEVVTDGAYVGKGAKMCHFLIQIACKFSTVDSAAFQALSTMEILPFLTYILQFRSYPWTPRGNENSFCLLRHILNNFQLSNGLSLGAHLMYTLSSPYYIGLSNGH